VQLVVTRQGSAFCIYFADHAPLDWHDLAASHDFAVDEQMRQNVIERGVYIFPLATKQCSISAAHTSDDIGFTLSALHASLEAACAAGIQGGR
jgi:glutamate-1-semialdehyde 2,1-aminomutase